MRKILPNRIQRFLFALGFVLLSPLAWGQTYNFDNVADGSTGTLSNGWVGQHTAGYRWEANAGSTPSTGTGPAVDHTLGTTAGIYMYVESSSPAGVGDTTTLTSPTLNLAGFSNPGLQFWYHKFGATMGGLYIDVFNGTTWVRNVDSIPGPVQSAETDPWLSKFVNLTSFSGNIQVRFRAINGTSFTGDMAIDDVSLVELPAHDFNIQNPSLNPLGYSIFPESQATGITFSGDLGNNGVQSGTNATMKVTVGTFVDSVVVSSLGAFSSTNVTTPTPFNGGIGVYNAAYEAYGDQADTIPTNNFDTLRFEVNDSIYARDDSLASGSLGIGAGTSGVLGQTFDITTTDTITSVSFWLNGPATGDTTWVDLYTFGAAPQSIIATTDTLFIPSATGAWYTLSFPCPVVLQPGTYFLGVNELNNNITLGTTSFNYQPNTTWVIFATNPWAPSENYGFPITYLLRANLGHPSVSLDLGPDQQFCSGTNVTLDAGAGYSSYLWSNGDTSQTSSVSTGGTYTVTVTTSAGCTYTDSVTVSPFSTLSAGSNNTASACETETGFNLMTALGGTPDMGGTWNDDNGSGGLSGSSLDASAAGVGTFDYTYSITDTCGNTNTATVTLTIDPEVSAGTNVTGEACDDDPATNLNSFLSGTADAGGTWTDNSSTGALTDSLFNSAQAGSGTYTFTYTVAGGACPDASATLTLTVDICSSIQDEQGLTFNLYPNPGQQLVRIELEKSHVQDTEVRLLNVLGAEVFRSSIPAGQLMHVLNLPSLSSGVYILELESEGKIARKRWIRE